MRVPYESFGELPKCVYVCACVFEQLSISADPGERVGSQQAHPRQHETCSSNRQNIETCSDMVTKQGQLYIEPS